MATLNQNEQRGAVDGLLKVAGEDAQQGGIILNYLQTVLPTFSWATQLRTRALIYAPFIASGLSIDWWVDEAIRYAAFYAQQ